MDSVGHFLGLPDSQTVPGKTEQGPDTQDLWGKEAERPGVLFFPPQKRPKAGDTCLLGAGRLMAPHFCFSSSSSETTESLLKGDTWTMVRALESSGKSSWSEHSLRPTVFV